MPLNDFQCQVVAGLLTIAQQAREGGGAAGSIPIDPTTMGLKNANAETAVIFKEFLAFVQIGNAVHPTISPNWETGFPLVGDGSSGVGGLGNIQSILSTIPPPALQALQAALTPVIATAVGANPALAPLVAALTGLLGAAPGGSSPSTLPSPSNPPVPATPAAPAGH